MIHKLRLNPENQKHFTTDELAICMPTSFGVNFFLDLNIAKYIKSQLSEKYMKVR